METTPPQAERRLAYFDGLRGVAAVLVAAWHFIRIFDDGLATGDPSQSPLGFEKYVAGTPLNLPFQGNLMVQIFFVLSGFVLVGAFLGNRTFLGAFFRRYLRLAVPVLASCLLAWLLLQFRLQYPNPMDLGGRTEAEAVIGAPPHFALGRAIGEGLYAAFIPPQPHAESALNGVLWTMPIEFSGSILILVLVFLGRRHPRAAVVALFFLSVLSWGYYEFFMLCGAWLYFFHERGGLRLDLKNPLVAGGLFAAFVLCGSYPNVAHPGIAYRLYAFDIGTWFDFDFQRFLYFVPLTDRVLFYHGVGAVALVWAVLNSPALMAFFGRLGFLGKISFPLYLVHMPILGAVQGAYFPFKHLCGGNAGLACGLTFLLYASSSLAVACLGYRLAEKPGIRLSKKIGAQIDLFLERAKPLV